MITKDYKLISIAFILLGISAAFDFVLSHGFSEAWRAWHVRQWEVTFAVIFTVAGIFNLIVIYTLNHLSCRRRNRARKAYGERY